MVVIATSKFFAGFFFCGLQPKFFFFGMVKLRICCDCRENNKCMKTGHTLEILSKMC